MKNEEVIVFSAARTGSTLIWQCLSKIFKKVHKFHDKKAFSSFVKRLPCVITERNRVEAFLSRARVLRFKKFSSEEFIRILNSDFDKAFTAPYSGINEDVDVYRAELAGVEYVKHCYLGKKLILQYEKFFNNYDYIFDQLESFFEFTIPVETKDSIVAETNLEVNEKIQDKFKDFDSHCEKSLIHGQHIISGEPDFYKNIISSENYSRLHGMLWENPDWWRGLYEDHIKKDNAS